MTGPEHPVAGRIVESIADSDDSDPLELPPVYESVDPDALDAFVRGTDHGLVEFHYAGHAVTVDSAGGVEVGKRIAADASPESAVSDD